LVGMGWNIYQEQGWLARQTWKAKQTFVSYGIGRLY
jgi:hypothetical protein